MTNAGWSRLLRGPRRAPHLRSVMWLSSHPGLAGFIVFFALAGTAVVAHQRSMAAKSQPIAFNHAKHIENGLACTDCHAGVQTQAKATLPAIDFCMSCHSTALGTSTEEAKLRKIAAAGEELLWTQQAQLKPHVFFSHRRHVNSAQLKCAECHGPMEQATAPPTAWKRLDMNACLNCHKQHGVNADCNDCHR